MVVLSFKNDIKELLKLQYIIQQFSVQHDLEDKIEIHQLGLRRAGLKHYILWL